LAGLEKWKNLAGTRVLNPILIYGGDDKYRLSARTLSAGEKPVRPHLMSEA
jgi:hypothetical protein